MIHKGVQPGAGEVIPEGVQPGGGEVIPEGVQPGGMIPKGVQRGASQPEHDSLVLRRMFRWDSVGSALSSAHPGTAFPGVHLVSFPRKTHILMLPSSPAPTESPSPCVAGSLLL